MILLKPEHVGPILSGQKTRTRRTGKKRWRIGSVHQCRLHYRAEPFARVKITGVRREKLGDISEVDAKKEGYPFRSGRTGKPSPGYTASGTRTWRCGRWTLCCAINLCN